MLIAVINGNQYQIAQGATFVDNYNETLDSGTIILPQLDSEIEIEPFDLVKITGDNIKTRFLLVDTYTCTQTCLNPAIYKYEITLCSLIKKLEGIILPNLTITLTNFGLFTWFGISSTPIYWIGII